MGTYFYSKCESSKVLMTIINNWKSLHYLTMTAGEASVLLHDSLGGSGGSQQIENKSISVWSSRVQSTITGQKSATSSSSSSTGPINRQFPLRTVQRKARSLSHPPQVKYAVLHKFASELQGSDETGGVLPASASWDWEQQWKKEAVVNVVFTFDWSSCISVNEITDNQSIVLYVFRLLMKTGGLSYNAKKVTYKSSCPPIKL